MPHKEVFFQLIFELLLFTSYFGQECWPIFIYYILKLKKEWKIIFLMIITIIFSLILNIIFQKGNVFIINSHFPSIAKWFSNGRSTIFYLMPFRIFEFAIGALLVWILRCKPKRKLLYDLFFWIGLIMIFYSVFTFNNDILFPSYYALIPCIGTAFVIYSGEYCYSSKFLTNRMVKRIGLISYSLYLVHLPLIVFWNYIRPDLFLIDKTLILIISFLLGILIYTKIEQPFRNKRILLQQKTWKYSFTITAIFLVVIGINIKLSNGWQWRISSKINFENISDSSIFHRKFYGGAGYPSYGSVKTESPADIVLIGDSHGRQYAEGIYEVLAKPNNLALYIAAGTSCIHLPGFTRNTKGYDWDKMCPSALRKALKLVENDNNPLVVISHSWVSQMGVADLLDENGNKLNIDVKENEIIEGIKRLTKIIEPSKLVVIGQVPTTGGKNLFDILTRPMIFNLFDVNNDKYRTSNINSDYYLFNQRLKTIAENTGLFVFLDPYDALCNDAACRNTDDYNRLIYSDETHLSKYGSKYVINKFYKDFLDILSKE